MALALVAVVITAAVYGAVAALVKADDIGLKLSQIGKLAATRSLGMLIVKSMPSIMALISFVGTAAMLWVGGSIIVHGLHELGVHAPYEIIKQIAASVSQKAGGATALVNWIVTATLDGILGLALGMLIIPIWTYALEPGFKLLRPKAN